MTFHIAAQHAIRAREMDSVFKYAAKADAAKAEYGSAGIINSTIGVLLDDDGKLVTFKTVYDELRNLDDALIANYASPPGIAEFLEASVKACFADNRPSGYIRSVATPGGTGAIHNAIVNFTNQGDTVLTPNWYWDPYKIIADETLRRHDTFNLFTEKGRFDFEDYKRACEDCLKRQDRLLVCHNTPAHNPTGFTITDGEWDQIIGLAVQQAKDKTKAIILLCDLAYIDFAADPNARKFMEKFGGLPENVICLFAYSASKSFAMYGLRNGALLCVTPVEDLAEEFFYSCAHSNRGVWSNGTRGAMQVVSNIYKDDVLYKRVEEERGVYVDMLAKRARTFFTRAKQLNTPMTNYQSGFFVSIPSDDPAKLADRLIEDRLFTVPLQKGVRVALCSVAEKDCAKAADIIDNAVTELGMK